MSRSFAVTFAAPLGAERALDEIRRWHSRRIVELDDAYLAARRNAEAEPWLDRPRLTGRSGLAARLFGRGAAPTVALNPERVRNFARSLARDSSALVLLVRQFDRSALRAALPPFLAAHDAQVLPLAAAADDEAPSAAQLAGEALARQAAVRAKRSQAQCAARSLQEARVARFMEPTRADEAIALLLQRCRHAAHQGRFDVLAYQFPSGVLTDRGRAVHAGDPTWPRTLRGEPALVYRYVAQSLLPKGYAAEATIVDYPDGLLGDVGLFLRWGQFGEG